MSIKSIRTLLLSRTLGWLSAIAITVSCAVEEGDARSVIEDRAASLAESDTARVALTLQLSGTVDVPGRNDDFVVLSTPGSASRPSAALTISLRSGRSQRISLSSSGSGAVSFDRNVVLVKAGTPTQVRVFGERVSAAIDDVSIHARLESSGRQVSEDLTVIAGVSLAFSGNFQARLPTDPDPRTEPRGVLGANRALEGEADLDNIIRFSEPVDLRLFCRFDPVHVTGVRAAQPAGAEFVGGDSLIGERVNLGPNAQFIDQDNDVDQERIDGFELHLASIHATGEFPLGGPVDYSFSGPLLDPLLADYRGRDPLLRAERMVRPDDDIEARRIDARLQLREEFRYDQWQLLFARPFCGTARDGDATSDRDSQLLTLLHDAASLDYRIDFFGFDGDCLRGSVIGTVRPFTPAAPALCPAGTPASGQNPAFARAPF